MGNLCAYEHSKVIKVAARIAFFPRISHGFLALLHTPSYLVAGRLRLSQSEIRILGHPLLLGSNFLQLKIQIRSNESHIDGSVSPLLLLLSSLPVVVDPRCVGRGKLPVSAPLTRDGEKMESGRKGSLARARARAKHGSSLARKSARKGWPAGARRS